MEDQGFSHYLELQTVLRDAIQLMLIEVTMAGEIAVCSLQEEISPNKRLVMNPVNLVHPRRWAPIPYLE